MLTEHLEEFDREIATTRRVLDAIPAGKLDWRPHPKSMTLAALAGHLAGIPGWVTFTLKQSELCMDGYQPPKYESTTQIMNIFEQAVVDGRAALAAAEPSVLKERWKLTAGGHTILDATKGEVLRTWCFNHLYHHRAQLGVYLRLLDVPVPSVYGPTADFQA